MASKKWKMFGPSTYATWAISALSLQIASGLGGSEWWNRPTMASELDPVERAEDRLKLLTSLNTLSQDTAIRVIDSVGACLASLKSTPREVVVREKVSKALRDLLKSDNPIFRGHAADVIGRVGHEDEAMADALVPMLQHGEEKVRIAAASALIKMKTTQEMNAAGLKVLAEMAADPHTRDRTTVMNVLRSGGGPGIEAGVQALTRLLKNPDPEVRAEAIRSAPGFTTNLSRDMLLSKFEPLWKSDDPQVRVSAAILVRQSRPATIGFNMPRPDPRLSTILEEAVIDPSLPLELRIHALISLGELRSMEGAGGILPLRDPLAFDMPNPYTEFAPILYRCGQALIRQLSDGNVDNRYSAASLLRWIDPGVVAGKFPGAPASSGELAPKP